MANTHSLDLELSSSQYAYHADDAVYDITGDLTIEAWIKLESHTTRGYILSKYLATDNNRSYGMGVYTDGKLLFVTSDDGANVVNKYADTAMEDGTWYHVAVSYDASEGTCAFYLNGSPDGTGTEMDTSLKSGTARLVVGTLDGDSPTLLLDGKVCYLRLWNDIRTPTEIADHYQEALAGTEDNLVGNWKFNNNYEDDTSNENDLTAVGSPEFSEDVPTWPAEEAAKSYSYFM